MAWGTMSKCEGDNKENAGSVILERPLKLWSLIIDSVRCGGGFQKPNRAKKQPGPSDKLSELLKQPQWCENEDEVKRKEQVLEVLKEVAKKLQHEDSIELVVEGAKDVRRLTKDDPHARTILPLLGVIPHLLSLLDSQDPTSETQIAALYALLNLQIANDANKAAIVIAGGVHKMLKLIVTQNVAVAEAVVANFLGLSALDSNKPIIGSSGAIPFLVGKLKDVEASSQAKQDSLRALYNLSISPSNVSLMLETDLIPYLFANLGDMDMSERILSILGNIVTVAEGRKGISAVRDAFPILIDVFNWSDSPECQEKASYILMVMAHKSYNDRQAMIEAGVVSSLLELTLLGSTLAQNRASRMLECLRVEKGKQLVSGNCGGGLSAPLSSTSSSVGPTPQKLGDGEDDDGDDDDEMMSRENKAVKQLVQQSLQSNMKRMVKRANLGHDFVPSDRFKSLTSSSTSKSLPF